MKIKISLTEEGEWSDCWLQTEYIKGKNEFRCFIYPTSWSELYRTDGFVSYMWVSSECPVKIKQWVDDCVESLKPKQDERITEKKQKACTIFERLLNWFNKVTG